MADKRYQDFLVDLVEPGSRVLDLGCGDGELLDRLRLEKNVQGYGIDILYDSILACTRRGISAFQGNLDEGLSDFSDHAFDHVILSQTLQQVNRPLFVIDEMLRVGKKGIVTFPNFGYWDVRLQVLLNGHAPKTKTLPYEWYETPNIRVLTIQDFRDLCRDQDISIVGEYAIDTFFSRTILPHSLYNLMCRRGLFVIDKKLGAA
jgi:methionine biosynthesis protein MetW